MSESPFPEKIYLSKVPGRWRQEAKLHLNLGHAKNAIACKSSYGYGTYYDMEIWELENGQWTKLFDVPAGTKRGEMPWQK